MPLHVYTIQYVQININVYKNQVCVSDNIY